LLAGRHTSRHLHRAVARVPYFRQKEPGIFDRCACCAPDRVTHSYIVKLSFLFKNLRKISCSFSPGLEKIAERRPTACIQAAASMMLFF
jgi:hypothetical protein